MRRLEKEYEAIRAERDTLLAEVARLEGVIEKSIPSLEAHLLTRSELGDARRDVWDNAERYEKLERCYNKALAGLVEATKELDTNKIILAIDATLIEKMTAVIDVMSKMNKYADREPEINREVVLALIALDDAWQDSGRPDPEWT